MKILALDTSNVALSVAVLENDQLLAIQTTNIKRNHSKQLMPIISQTLKTAEVSLADLDRIVVAKGPGLRIAVTTAKTLAMTLEIELVGISSLAMLVPNAPNDGLVVPFFDARNQNVFAGIYEKHGMEVTPVVADQHLSFESLLAKINELGRSVYFINNPFEKFQPMVEDTLRVIAEHSTTLNSLPTAYALGLLGLQKQALENYYTFVPAYLRVTEAERNWKEKPPNDESKESYVRQIN